MKLIYLLALLPIAANAEVYSTCMDSHGSTYTYKADTCPSVDAINMTPEYMYTDRVTQRLQMILNQRTVQAEANIARAGTPLPSSSTTSTIMNNEQGQNQNQGQSSDNTNTSRSNSNANSTADSNSDAVNSNSNVNSNTTGVFTGVFN